MTFCILNNALIPVSEAHISIEDRGFRFGDGVFETIAVYQGIPYQWDLHMNRLSAGLKALSIDANISLFEPMANELLAKNNVKHGTLRIAISRGVGSHGYMPTSTKPTVVMEAYNRNFAAPERVNICLSRIQKTSAAALPVAYKLMQGLNSTLAKIEATQNNCFESLMLNEKGQVAEVSSGNIFWIKDNVLYTPTLECGLVEGTTRSAVLRISPIKTVEGVFTTADVLAADEVFITNTHWQVLPVDQLVEKRWSSYPITQQIYHLLKQDIEAYVASRNT